MQSDYDYLIEQLEYAREQLDIADSLDSKLTWGNRCDQLEAALSDHLSTLNIL
jgi:hypothetical protein